MAYGRDNDGPIPPHWMKSMEERYQRLHTKISDQAIKLAQSKNSLTVRLRKLHQGKYGQRLPNSVKVRANNSNLPKDKVGAGVVLDQAPTHPPTESVSDHRQKRPRTHPGLHTDLNNDLELSTLKNDGRLRSNKIDDAPRCRSKSVMGSPKVHSEFIPLTSQQMSVTDPEVDHLQVDDEKEITRLSEDRNITNAVSETKLINTIRHRTQTDSAEQTPLDISNNGCCDKDKQTTSLTVEHVTSTLGTAISKNRDDDPKRCRIVPRNQYKKNYHSKSATPFHTNTDRRMLVSARMSREAQYAIDETLKEMTLSMDARAGVEQRKESLLTNNLLNLSTDSIKSKEYEQEEISSSTSDEDIVPKIEKHTKLNNTPACGIDTSGFVTHQKNKEHMEKAVPCTNFIKPKRTCVNTFPVHEVTTRTPSVPKRPQTEKYPRSHHDNILLHRRHLPVVSNVTGWLHCEDTFKITNPDFDIRFTEHPVYPRRDDETPPVDIRQRSIDKCRLWLEQQQMGRL